MGWLLCCLVGSFVRSAKVAGSRWMVGRLIYLYTDTLLG